MGTRRNVIMLNGNRYDASTGELIQAPSTPASTSSNKKPASIDGFVSSNQNAPTRKPHAISRPALKSKTLMRSAVKKPSHSLKPTTQQTKHIKTSPQLVNPMRESRAKEVSRSKLISKFGSEVKRITKYSAIPLATPPKNTTHIEKIQSNPSTKHKQASQTAKPINHFEQAIHNSTSHTNQKGKKQNRRHKLAKKLRISPSLLNVSILIVVGLVLGGYFAYNNVPNLAMRVASTRAGIDGSMPDYQPTGFSMKGAIQYQPGQILVSYRSNSDNRSYTVAQRNSDWNSEALLENHVASNQRQYQTFQDKGKTIYIYDGDSASWVDNGVWYEIDGNSSLNTDQVLRIANSL